IFKPPVLIQFQVTADTCEFAEAHQRFLALYNTTAHQGLLKERFASPIPLHVLGDSKGRLVPPQELTRKFAQALFVRTTNRYGCVTLHRSHFYVDQGLAETPVLLWVAGEDLRAVYDHVLLAEYSCHYDLLTSSSPSPPAPTICARARPPASAWGNGIPARLRRVRPRVRCWSARHRT